MSMTNGGLGFYATHGRMTDPGRHADLLGGLPADVGGLARTVQGVMTHKQVPEVPESRLAQMRAHSAEEILGRIRELDGRPLVEPRPPQRRTVGNCAHAATLFCSLVRGGGLPARVRDGFAAYLAPDFWINHRITEWWNEAEERWVRADAELDEGFRKARDLSFDLMDLPAEQFVSAGEAWRRCRAGEADPDRFGYPGVTGMGYIAQRVALDLAALNKVELLPYDRWGLLEKQETELTADDLALLDRVAGLTAAGDESAFGELLAVYEAAERLRVPPVISYRDERGEGTYRVGVDSTL